MSRSGPGTPGIHGERCHAALACTPSNGGRRGAPPRPPPPPPPRNLLTPPPPLAAGRSGGGGAGMAETKPGRPTGSALLAPARRNAGLASLAARRAAAGVPWIDSLDPEQCQGTQAARASARKDDVRIQLVTVAAVTVAAAAAAPVTAAACPVHVADAKHVTRANKARARRKVSLQTADDAIASPNGIDAAAAAATAAAATAAAAIRRCIPRARAAAVGFHAAGAERHRLCLVLKRLEDPGERGADFCDGHAVCGRCPPPACRPGRRTDRRCPRHDGIVVRCNCCCCGPAVSCTRACAGVRGSGSPRRPPRRLGHERLVLERRQLQQRRRGVHPAAGQRVQPCRQPQVKGEQRRHQAAVGAGGISAAARVAIAAPAAAAAHCLPGWAGCRRTCGCRGAASGRLGRRRGNRLRHACAPTAVANTIADAAANGGRHTNHDGTAAVDGQPSQERNRHHHLKLVRLAACWRKRRGHVQQAPHFHVHRIGNTVQMLRSSRRRER
eukprot:361263-Chlamydomonas_euryale.AAC.1